MKPTELGRLSYEVSPESLREIVASGKVLEFANTVAAINVFEGGDFGTVPVGPGPKGPRPKVSVLFGGNALSHVIDIAEIRNIARP